MQSTCRSIPLVCGIFLAALVFSNCTDSEQAKFDSYGEKCRIEVFSGGQIIRTYTSTGKVMSGKLGVYYFKDSETGKLVEVSGQVQVIITRLD